MAEAAPPGAVPAPAPGGWLGSLQLHYRRDGDATRAHDRHQGPLRVLQPLYPEGPGICHHVLLHPPGGVVGGDRLEVDVQVDAGAHALLTTPGATRFYRSEGLHAAQQVRLRLAAGARLEWLPLETIAYAGCDALNQVSFELQPGASLLGWDLLALGLPAAGAAFDAGVFEQCLQWPGRWLERGRIAGADQRLLRSPLGLGGQPVLGCAWFATAGDAAPPLLQALTEDARALVDASPLAAWAGVTCPRDDLVVLRLLAPRTEPAMALMAKVRGAWRQRAWGLSPVVPRIWRS